MIDEYTTSSRNCVDSSFMHEYTKNKEKRVDLGVKIENKTASSEEIKEFLKLAREQVALASKLVQE